MRNSIKIYLLAFTAILLTGSIFAQRGKKDFNPEDRATKKTERLTEALNLDAAQAEKIKTIHLKYGTRIHALRSQDTGDDRSEKRAAMQQIRTDIDAEIKVVLTDEQYQKFQELPKGRRGGKGQKGWKDGERHKHRRAFHNEKIKPILLEQRAKLESKISDDDKVALAQLRVDIKKERAEHRANKKERKASSDKRERPTREEMEQRKAERKNNPNHIKLVALTEKYKADIESLLTEVEPKIKALKEEMKKERKAEEGEWKKEGSGEKARKGRKGGKRHGKMEGKDDGDHVEKQENRKYARFLLLDPNKETKAEKRPRKSTSSISKVKVYPNPSQGISQIEYQLKTPGLVAIELHDKEGNLLSIIEKAEKSAGKHKASINFSNYTVGIYYIVLKDANGGVISKKVVR